MTQSRFQPGPRSTSEPHHPLVFADHPCSNLVAAANQGVSHLLYLPDTCISFVLHIPSDSMTGCQVLICLSLLGLYPTCHHTWQRWHSLCWSQPSLMPGSPHFLQLVSFPTGSPSMTTKPCAEPTRRAATVPVVSWMWVQGWRTQGKVAGFALSLLVSFAPSVQ